MPVMTTTEKTTPGGNTYLVSRNGFPVEECTRCGGTGQMPFSAYQGVCFKCHGNAYTYVAGLPGKLAAEFSNAFKTAKDCTPATRVVIDEDGTVTYRYGVQPGQEIRRYGSPKGTPFLTIASVHTTREVYSICTIGAGDNAKVRNFSLKTVITFTDGTTVNTTGESWTPRLDTGPLVQLRDDLAARACAAYEKTLDNRARRAARAR